jgi:hypothetical protein
MEPATSCTAAATVPRTFSTAAETPDRDDGADRRAPGDRRVDFDAAARAAVLRRAVLVVVPGAAAFLAALVLAGLVLAGVFLTPPFAAAARAVPRAGAFFAAPARPAAGVRLSAARPAFALFFVGFRLATLDPPQGTILSLVCDP